FSFFTFLVAIYLSHFFTFLLGRISILSYIYNFKNVPSLKFVVFLHFFHAFIILSALYCICHIACSPLTFIALSVNVPNCSLLKYISVPSNISSFSCIAFRVSSSFISPPVIP